MLISRVPDEPGAEGRGMGRQGGQGAAEEMAHNFQTASELFELMTKDHDFEAGDDALTTRDLVLLYKNIDLGKQLMSNVHELKLRAPNQYVEDVIYRDEAETDSDLSETYSSEDLHNIMVANRERIDLLTSKPSLDSLCHKLGDLEIQVSNLSTNYDRRFLFKDPYINEQLKSLRLMSKTNELDTTTLPTSLLDYICCKRLEDNHNFYMDNIITYVNHTIEQLKRISNGDYLPDRVKEKWREVESARDHSNTSKVLSTSSSTPLQIERKVTGLTTAWDELIHSEVNLTSLVKILEKKIVVDVPKIICGSYKLFSNYETDNLVISCKRKKRAPKKEETHVDVVVQLQRSNTGQVLGNINSIMILQPRQQIVQKDSTNMLPLTYIDAEKPRKYSPRVIELSENEPLSENKTSNESNDLISLGSLTDYRGGCDSLMSSRPGSPTSVAQMLSSVSRVIRAEAVANHASPNELHFSMINLNRQTSLPEEDSMESLDYTKPRKKSPTKIRIKSPYENKSVILEERKRRRLLELRERRERRKMSMDNNSKVSKHKAVPQAVNSVTKLSITNKAFYNSIYGRNVDDKRAPTALSKIKGRKEKQDTDGAIQEIDQESEGESLERESIISDSNMKTNKPHFLDDADTEMSYLQRKLDEEFLRISTSTSAISNESAPNLCPQSECPSLTSLGVIEQLSPNTLEKQRSEPEVEMAKPQSGFNRVPANSPKSDSEKVKPAVQCRRSLEKIHTLMKKLREIESNETNIKKKTTTSNGSRGPFSSESGTSLNHRLSYTNPSSTSFEKPDDQNHNKGDESDRPTTIVPKVVINAKPSTETKKDRKAKFSRIRTIPENPLRAISQLLHEFDNVQKSRQKIVDPKSINRSMSTDARSGTRPELQKKRSRIETAPAKEDPPSKVTAKVKTRFISREEMRPEVPKPHILDKKNLNDLIDEAKEARGEAVRGPAKFSSRLNALAQPKRAYVQALNDEFPKRQTPERAPRPRRRGGEVHSSLVSVKQPGSIELTGQPRRSAGSSPDSRQRQQSQFAALAAAAANTILPKIKKKVSAVSSVGSRRGCSPERVDPTRAPLLPISDVELFSLSSSQVDATSIGSKLHHMVQSVMRSERAALRPRSTGAAAAAASRMCLDKRIPTVLKEPSPHKPTRNERRNKRRVEALNPITPVNSVTELEMLEHALHQCLSSGTFPGRLRIKKLTLTPKPSLQQIAMHQSGDNTSIALKSDSSQKITISAKSDDRKTDLMALLSTTRMNCRLYGFPLQISTVGYAIPIVHGEVKKLNHKIFGKGLWEMVEAGTKYTESFTMSRANTVLQIEDEEETTRPCFVGQPRPAARECAVQVCGSNSFLATATTTVAQELRAPRKHVETSTTQESTIISDSWDTVRETRDKDLSDPEEENHQLSDYTTSLDMLVGLLNEIQMITTSAGDGPSAHSMERSPRERSPLGRDATAGSTAALHSLDERKTDDHVSLIISKADVSSDGLFEIIIPETKSVGVCAEVVERRRVYEDKEAWARISAPQHHADVNTDPAHEHEVRLSPSLLDAGTSTIIVPKSTCSISTATKSESDVSSETSVKPDDQTESNRNSVKSLVPFYDNIFIKMENARRQTAAENKLQNTVSKKTSYAACDILVDTGPGRPSEHVLNKCDDVHIRNNEEVVMKHGRTVGEFDSSIKMKRDLLVTFYSILVLTVFAALAFPEFQFLQQA